MESNAAGRLEPDGQDWQDFERMLEQLDETEDWRDTYDLQITARPVEMLAG